MSQKIKQAEMHENMFIPSPGIGEVRKQLSNVDTGLNRGVNMRLEAGLVYLDLPQKDSQKRTLVIVPATNFKYLMPEPE